MAVVPPGTYNIYSGDNFAQRVRLAGAGNAFTVAAPDLAPAPNQAVTVVVVGDVLPTNNFQVQVVGGQNFANQQGAAPISIVGQNAQGQYVVNAAPGGGPGQFLIQQAGGGLVWTAVPGAAGAPDGIQLQGVVAAPGNANQRWSFVWVGPP